MKNTIINVVAAVVLAAFVSRSAGDAKTATLVARNGSGHVARNIPLTFGQVFSKGDIRDGVVARVGGKPAQIQTDIKRRYEDGSVRFAVVSLALEEVPANGQVQIELANGVATGGGAAILPEDLLKTPFDAIIRFTFPEGSQKSASARQMLERAGAGVRQWLGGLLVTEWLVDGPPTDAAGKPDPDLNVQYQIRVYAGCKIVRVSAAVENCWDTWAGNIGYEVAITGQDDKPIYQKKEVDHGRLSRWRKVFYWGEAPADVTIDQDLAYLSATGAVPNYDSTLQLPKRLLGSEPRSADTDILERGYLAAYMPTTGGRPEIGPYPGWAAAYLMTMSPRLRPVVLSSGDLAGSWPIHVRNSKTKRLLTIDERPDFWLDERGKDRPNWQPDRKPRPASAPRLVSDCAHQPSLAYIPYLLTGDFYYLEEAYFWGNYSLLSQWPGPAKSPTRERDRGLMADQIRGNAWGLRNIADAGSIAPDGDPEGAYFQQKIRNNFQFMIEKMYGPPALNSMGFWGLRTVEDARIQNAANPNWLIYVPWETDFLIWSLHHLTELGHADAAKPRDFLLRARVGALTHAPDFDPQGAAPYRMVVGEQLGAGVVIYEDWKKLNEENAKLGKAELPAYGGSYSYVLRLALVCGVDGGFPEANDALRTLESALPRARENLAAEPAWAIAPRK
ncbi:MAG: hypothetical protein NTU53_21335 [Planctomycetota bacterium]|nr:hypothetical protein [Planctomycetota bacterium]